MNICSMIFYDLQTVFKTDNDDIINSFYKKNEYKKGEIN